MTFKNYSETEAIGYEVVRETKSMSNIKPVVEKGWVPYKYRRTANGKLDARLEEEHDGFLGIDPGDIVSKLIEKHGGE